MAGNIKYNKATGQSVMFDGTSWVPAETRHNKAGDAVAFDGSSWVPVGKKTMQAPRGDMSWGDVGSHAVENIGPSALQLGKDMVQPFAHPIETAKTIGQLGEGLVRLAIPGGNDPSEDMARSVGTFFANRYGGIEELKKTIATDPAGLMADISTILTGGGGIAARAPGMIGKVGRAVQVAGKISDPVNIAGKTLGTAGAVAGKVLDTAPGQAISSAVKAPVPGLLGLSTGVGAEPIKAAYRSGLEGGEASKAFRDGLNLKEMTSVASDAQSALRQMKANMYNSYKNNMKAVNKDPKVLDFGKVEDAVSKAKKVGTYDGVPMDPKSKKVLKRVDKLVKAWKSGDPKTRFTAEGLDQLKQRIGKIYSQLGPKDPGFTEVREVYNGVKGTIIDSFPEYSKAMKKYSQAADEIVELERELSLGNKAAASTSLRKLQSAMRDNVNTSWGQRRQMVGKLDEVGGENIIPKLAGQSLSSPAPRGLSRIIGSSALPVLAGGAAGIGPGAAIGLLTSPAFSPRLVGEAALAAGKGSRKLKRAGKLAKDVNRIVGPGGKASAFQSGRIGLLEDRNR